MVEHPGGDVAVARSPLSSLSPIYLVVPGAGTSPPALLALYLVLISALTLPHVVVVFWTDAIRLLEPLLDANYDAARRTGLPSDGGG